MRSISILSGRRLLGEAHPARQALHMGIHHHPFVDPEGVSENDVRGLSPDPGKAGELHQSPGKLASMLSYQGPGHPDEVLRLVSEKPCGVDHLFQLVRRSGSQSDGIGIAPEQLRCDLVHSLVGALGREDGGHRQLKGISMVQRRHRLGVFPLEKLENECGPLLSGSF